MARLTLEEIEQIYKNRTEYYVVYYKDGKEHRECREDINKARALFYRIVKDLYEIDFINISCDWLCDIKENPYKLSLIEVAKGNTSILLGYGKESLTEHNKRWSKIYEEEKRLKEEEKKKSAKMKTMTEMLLGDVSIDEYNNSLELFASLHGTTLKSWGIDKL